MVAYIKALARIKANDQELMLTIMPNYLSRTNSEGNILKDGWENPKGLKQFRFYVEQVTKV